jgi:thioredoxin reductase (NADPH)
MQQSPESFEIAIVGAGPIGIEMAVALKREGIRYVHFEGGQIGNTMMWWAPGTKWFSSNDRISIAGVPLMTANQDKATREEYLAYLRAVVTQFDLEVRTYQPVRDVQRDADGFTITTEARGRRIHTRVKKIILATGGTDRPRKLHIAGEDLPHVSAYFRDPHTYFRKQLLVIGGKNSAVEAALRCHHAGASVAISYRRSELPARHIKYWLMPEIGGLIKAGKIEAHFDTVPVAITPEHVTLKRGTETFDVPADFVLKLIGYEQDNALLKMCDIELVGDDRMPRYNPQTMESNVPGLYVAGTAIAGTQTGYKIFLENCHAHVAAILAHLTGRKPPEGLACELPQALIQPES